MVARKPLSEGSVAGNVLRWGTGGLNVDGCRVNGGSRPLVVSDRRSGNNTYGDGLEGSRAAGATDAGRWPTNIVMSHSAGCVPAGTRQVRGSSRADRGADTNGIPSASLSGGVDGSLNRVQSPGYADADGLEEVEVWVCDVSCPVGELDRQSGVTQSPSVGGIRREALGIMNDDSWQPKETVRPAYADSGGASRFYPVFKYQAKAPASERPRLEDGTAHETVKPLGLVCWLVRLITPPGGTVLDMFAGSGPVGEAAVIEGFRCVLIEKERKSAELIRKRLGKPIQPVMFGLEA